MLRFALIGETSLLIACARHILKNKNTIEITIVCTKNPMVVNWCHAHDINVVGDLGQFQKYLEQIQPDYLFSIVNLKKISTQLLRSIKHLAINYHDALLPRYAGVHATSWAILNNEKEHGISWHAMTAEFDAGDILEQAHIVIDDQETALTLNLKCYEAALFTFKLLIAKLLSH